MDELSRDAVTFTVVVPIVTNFGTGETRRVGPRRIVFAISAPFAPGDDVRFSLRLRGNGTNPIEVFCSGRVRAVTVEGTMFVVDSTIDRTHLECGGHAAALDGESGGVATALQIPPKT